MVSDEHPMESAKNRESLRLIVAVYFMALAMRLLPDIGGMGLFRAVLPENVAPHAYAVSVFTAAWFILAGQRLPFAASFLVAFTVFSQAFVPPEAAEFSLLRQVILVGALLLVGGFFDKEPVRSGNPGRIRLVRVKASRRRVARAARAAAAASGAPASTSRTGSASRTDGPFAPIPEEMDLLFDQIAVTR